MSVLESEIKDVISKRSDDSILRDWKILENEVDLTPDVIMIRGFYMDEIEKRWPEEFDEWMESFHKDITDIVKLKGDE